MNIYITIQQDYEPTFILFGGCAQVLWCGFARRFSFLCILTKTWLQISKMGEKKKKGDFHKYSALLFKGVGGTSGYMGEVE